MNPAKEKNLARAGNTEPGNLKAHSNSSILNGNSQGENRLLHSDKFLARAEEAGRQLIYSWTENGITAGSDLPPDRFPGLLRGVAERVKDAISQGSIGFSDVLAYFVDAPDGIRSEFIEATQGFFPPSAEACAQLKNPIIQWYKANRSDLFAARLESARERGEDPSSILREWATLDAEADSTGIADLLAARAFDPAIRPEKPIARLLIADRPLCTPGNLGNIQSPPKGGKSGVVGAIIAAVMNGRRQGPDTLGFDAENPHGHALIHIDTEQSRFDADALVRRAIRRAQLVESPPWLLSYSLADLSISERREALRHVLAAASEKFGGVFAVLVDGVGDLCMDPNDAEESFGLVHELHALAIRYDTVILTVLHENPGSETGKTRGHLGSQLERKAETNLRLAKDSNGITTVWAERARHTHLPKESGLCFQWSDIAGMHVSCGTAGEIKSAASRERMQDEAEKAFGDNQAMTYTQLFSAIVDLLEVSERTAKARVKTWLEEGITFKDSAGNHRLKNP